jgi:hypothetical protein
MQINLGAKSIKIKINLRAKNKKRLIAVLKHEISKLVIENVKKNGMFVI